MYESVSGGSSLDFAQTIQVSALEAATAMLELPQRRVRRARVEDVAHYTWSGKGIRGTSST